MTAKIPAFIQETADETARGGLTRRDFFKYAALLGLSVSMAGDLLGLTQAEASEIAADMDWAALGKESPFEIKNLLIDLARKSSQEKGCAMLNAGRGNPNFLNTMVREAFALLTLFAAGKAHQGSDIGNVGFRIRQKGLAKTFFDFLEAKKDMPGAVFLADAMEYTIKACAHPAAENKGSQAHRDQVVFQLTDAVQGDFYPDPPRIYPAVEATLQDYLEQVVFTGKQSARDYHLFATEGATAAMIYIFNSLRENMVLNPGDKVAIVTPVFSPYLELPLLSDYGLETVYIRTQSSLGWQIPQSELNKLKDTGVKALYLVNPANPTSTSLGKKTVRGIAKTIRKYNPNMIIISDTVYANFVEEFHTIGNELPENILGVYSFSKYFGVTGWRLGVVMMHKDCVVDKIIAQLPQKDQARLDGRYRLTSTRPREIPYYERLEMDSRQVALAHTGGLSGPQQVFMNLCACFELLDREKQYKADIMSILQDRWTALFKGLELPEPTGTKLTRYYALIDLKEMAEKLFGTEFSQKLEQQHPLAFLVDLARDHSVVCLPGQGFAGAKWSLRVALANLDKKGCHSVGKAVVAEMKKYHQQLS